uniref:Embryonal Fyn-associated substrate n=1 Tax=Tetraodon nigroviridis TaxID=99883 RepID=H3D8K5_TETNG
MKSQTVLAKALFDNAAESPEELGFRKGDILMVLKREHSGPGWWLCSLHGRQGIAPANRLRLLQTAPSPAPDDSAVYLSPGSPLGDGVAPRPAPSLRGRGTDAMGTLYQSPVGTVAAVAKSARQPAALLASESVYLCPAGVPRAADPPGDATYLILRESATAEVSDDCYLVPKGTPLASDEVYQSPTGGVAAQSVCSNGMAGASKATADTPGMYQTPTNLPRTQATVLAHQHPSQVSSRPHRGAAPVVAVARGTPNLACHRGSPLLVRAGHVRVPGSPGFTRKPPPPAPPVRGVTSLATLLNGLRALSGLRQVYDTPPSSRWQRPAPPALGHSDDIYDTPRSVPPPAEPGSEHVSLAIARCRYDQTRGEQHSQLQSPYVDFFLVPVRLRWPVWGQVYDVPTITLNVSDSQPEEGADEDVYSVPTLPGVPLATAESGGGDLAVEAGQAAEAYRARSSGGEPSEPDCGVYDLPAPTAEGLSHFLPSPSACTPRRLSVSSTGSGEVPRRASLCGLVHSVLGAPPAPLPPRPPGTWPRRWPRSWRPGGRALQQAWARLSDLLPTLTAAGTAAPPEGLLLQVQRSLEESALLLQAQGRPRLPSQESLSRRPLPALPGADGKASASGMGSRKGSWIQERPLPPTPPPSYPLNATPPTITALTVGGPAGGEDEPGNEYAGIGLTPVPAPLPTGDSVGYVKLQRYATKERLEGNITKDSAHGLLLPQPPAPSPGLPVSLSLEDSELLSFYSSQSLAHLSCLADAIDVLYSSVQGNQPPRIFVARGKSLIVTAHKLVFIGDTLSRLLTSPDLRAKITTSGGRLCQALKAVVVATKGAAQNYPSVSATQEMVDRVAELSQQAAGFSTLLQRLAET